MNENKKSWKVYKLTNLCNGKIYIGVTSQIPEKRWCKGKAYHGNPHLTAAIEKYSWENFSHEILEDNLTREQAGELEEYYINKFNTLSSEFGYNKIKGGFHDSNMYKDFVIRKLNKKVNKYDLEGNFIESYDSLIEAGIKNNLSSSDISCCCNKKNFCKTLKNNVYRFADTTDTSEDIYNYINSHGLDKEIVQYTLDDEFVAKYKSIRQASRQLNINSGNISLCASGKAKTYKGFIWKYTTEELTEEEILFRNNKASRNFKNIAQYSLEGKLIEIFLSAKLAQDKTGTDSSSIIKCCRGKQKTAKGFLWKYIEVEK